MIQKQTENRTMLTDLYQLTMGAAYFENGKNDMASFELFIRKLPKDWGFFIANGIEDAIDYATNMKFESEDIEFLREQNMFSENYLNFLREFKFNGEIHCVKEGTPIVPNTPIMGVRGPRIEAQLLETMLLNCVNFGTLIATKANRIVNAAAPGKVVDYGLRRAQEMGAAMKGARAAYIAGAIGTSNVLAGKEFGIPIFGTHAHSFVMSFTSELEAFRAYVKTFPNNPTLLIDTYDTLQGARNAAIVGKELSREGKKLGAVRIDSGDLAKISGEVRTILDNERLRNVRIMASNDLNEFKIKDMNNKGARIDGYGVGTELITAKPIAAVPGVYKLVEDEEGAKIKLSAEKKSYPGRKQVYRVCKNGTNLYDVLALEGENVQGTPLLEKVVENGQRTVCRRTLNEIREYCMSEVAKMPLETRNVFAEAYEVKESEGLKQLVNVLSRKYSTKEAQA